MTSGGARSTFLTCDDRREIDILEAYPTISIGLRMLPKYPAENPTSLAPFAWVSQREFACRSAV